MSTTGTAEFRKQTRVYVPQLKTNWHLQRIAFFGSADVAVESTLYQTAYACAQESRAPEGAHSTERREIRKVKDL